jgi:hypothetical protein
VIETEAISSSIACSRGSDASDILEVMRWLVLVLLVACESKTPPEPDEPCIVPGVYALTSDAQWTCDPPGRSVGMFAPFQIFALRVQTAGDTVTIDRVRPEPPHEPMSGDIVLVKDGCTVRLSMTTGRRMKAELVFARDRFAGTVTDMEYGGGDSGGGWQCRVDHAKVTGARL